MKSVELKTAYFWTCEECYHDNFAYPVKAELTDDEAEEIFRQMNEMDQFEQLPENWRDFEMIQIPDMVTCSTCKTKFETLDERL
jgi:hypothetical protein